MGSGDWFKKVISSKKVKGSSPSPRSNGFKWKNQQQKESADFPSGSNSENPKVPDMPVEDLATIQIQTAFRAYMARKKLRHLKRVVRLQILVQNYSVKKQATTTLNHLHSWSKIQADIRARRACMVTEGRLKQKKLENQLKLEAKLHDLEVEWCGGSETMEEILARIHQREEAAVKRERTMAYAFSHQWRANPSQHLGMVSYELGRANWSWSWMERWIAAHPWENCVCVQPISPIKAWTKQPNKVGKGKNSPTPKTPVSSKSPLSNGKGPTKARRLSYPAAEDQAIHEGTFKANEASTKKGQQVSKPPLSNGKGTTKTRRLSYPAGNKLAKSKLEGSIKCEEANTEGKEAGDEQAKLSLKDALNLIKQTEN